MRHRRGHRDNLQEIGRELNIVPYLDIMVNLVMFMLVNITGFVAYTILNASIPQIVTGESPTPPGPKSLLLMVRVSKTAGFDVDPSVQGGKSMQRLSIPKKGEEYDFAALHDFAATIKKSFPTETRVLIIGEPRVIYDDIIKTMDVLRETEPGGKPDLFPDVTLSIL